MKRVLGVIGYPIKHSLSPVIHNTWLDKYKIDAVYGSFEVEPERLNDAMSGIKALGILGVNVTVPHKVEVMKYLDSVSEEARQIGAVNTIKNENGRLVGYNTDLYGFERALNDKLEYRLTERSRVLVFGAGGVARMVVYFLKNIQPKKLVLVNRTRSKAVELIKKFRLNAQVYDYSDVTPQFLSEFDLIINCTSLGLKEEDRLFDYKALTAFKGRVFDLVYHPENTSLVKECLVQGLKAIDGKYMLIYQAARAFEIWFGILPDTSIIEL